MKLWKINRESLYSAPPPDDSYLEKARGIALDWLNGREEFLLHTSGSTGTPKPILLKRRQMVASAHLTRKALDLPQGTRALVCLNVQYIAGIMMMVRGMELGWELTIMEPVKNPLLPFEAYASFNFIAMVPLQLQACLHNRDTRPLLDRCGKILLGGAAVSRALEKEIQSLPVPVFQSYGMTETVSHVALRLVNTSARQADYQVLEGIEFGVDSRQCLYVRGAVTDFLVIQTNDLVEITSQSTFKWLGRADAVINSGGLKINLDTMDKVMEEVLLEMDITDGFFCWYEVDAILGQKLVLFLETYPSPELPEKITERLAEKVKSHEVPKAVYFVERFARTPTDKPDKIKTAQTYYTVSK